MRDYYYPTSCKRFTLVTQRAVWIHVLPIPFRNRSQTRLGYGSSEALWVCRDGVSRIDITGPSNPHVLRWLDRRPVIRVIHSRYNPRVCTRRRRSFIIKTIRGPLTFQFR